MLLCHGTTPDMYGSGTGETAFYVSLVLLL